MKQHQNGIYEPHFVKDLFNKMSRSYERMNYFASFGFSVRWRRQFVNIYDSSKENLEIIDLLSGMGETWKFILKKFPNAKLSALDFSEEMTKYATQKNQKFFSGKIEVLKQDILNNTLQNDYYDHVFCGFGLKTFNDSQIEILSAEVFRILKSGGQFSFIEISKPKSLVLKNLYQFYLKKIVPILGKLYLGDAKEYEMLWKYTENFQNAEKAMQIFSKNGLNVEFKQYFFGCATGLSGKKI